MISIDIDRPVIELGDIRRHSPDGSYPPILSDGVSIVLSQQDFDALPRYGPTLPSGVYHGKCWYDPQRNLVGCYLVLHSPAYGLSRGIWTLGLHPIVI